MNKKHLSTICLSLILLGTAQFSQACASTTEYHLTFNETYQLENYSSFPIFYGASTAWAGDGSNDNNSRKSGVTSLTLQPGSNPARTGNNGILLPAQPGQATYARVLIDGESTYDHHRTSGTCHHVDMNYGLFYVLNFSWPRGRANYTFSSMPDYHGNGYTSFYVGFHDIPQMNADVTPCYVSAPQVAGPVNQYSHTLSSTVTIAFYNSPHTCTAPAQNVTP